jgi:hypothetical protein
MKCSAWLLVGLVAIASLFTGSAYAQGPVPLSWVSANGSDANFPCSYVAPCQTLGGAIPKTSSGGQIICSTPIFSGGFTIDRAVTIDCAGTFGGIGTPSSNNVIIVGAGPSDKVILRNLNLTGLGIGTNGINFAAGAELELDNVKIEGMGVAGISASRTTTGVVVVKNSTFSKMPTGIKLQTTGGNIVLSVRDSTFNYLSANGVEAGTNVFAGVYSSTFTALNGTAILAATATSTVYAENNAIQNTWVGISAAVSGARISASGNGLYGNSKAFNVAAGAIFRSASNSKIDQNPGDPSNGALALR